MTIMSSIAFSPPRPTKRRRLSSGYISPITPLSPEDENSLNEYETSFARRKLSSLSDEESSTLIINAAHVLRTESLALAHISSLYTTSQTAQQFLMSAVTTILSSQSDRGKLIVTGVGKSAYIAQKFVATCKSLGVSASFMHACEAAHGDLGDIRTTDVLLFVSFSGRTPELMNLLPHIDAEVPLIAMCGVERKEDCMLLEGRDGDMGTLLPCTIPEKEEASFGVCAPTTSTTVALAVGDMLALTLAGKLHEGKRTMKDVFRRNHPGGAIGMATKRNDDCSGGEQEIRIVRDTDNCGQEESRVVAELPSPSISTESED